MLELSRNDGHNSENVKAEMMDTAEFVLTPIQLEPFLHQVGGHSSIFSLNEKTICKPLISEELDFYEKLPAVLKRFTPEYKGVIQVRYVEESDGYIRLDAYAPKSSIQQLQFPDDEVKTKAKRRIRLKKTGSIDIQGLSNSVPKQNEEPTPSILERRPSISLTIPLTEKQSSRHKWAKKCRENGIQKMQQESRPQNYIMLENVSSGYQAPCVLDMKMGTQQYGKNATPEKVKSKSAKADTSTSSKLGVRICGMQVYHASTSDFHYRDKYEGQKLDVSGFQSCLTEFFFNGEHIRYDALTALTRKLKELKSLVESLDGFRFFTSSLLRSYEGMSS